MLERKCMEDFKSLIKKLSSSIEKIEMQTESIIKLEKAKNDLQNERENLIKDSIKIKQKVETLLQKIE